MPAAVLTAVDDYLARNPVTGLALARDDALLVERYRYDRRDTQRFTSFGMARTLVGMMVGVALDEGRFRALDDPAQAYLPSLAGSAWGPVPLRALLTLRSGVRAGEDDPACLSCGGILKSDTISFGQALVPEVIDRAMQVAGEADLLLAIGSTLQVYPVAGAVPLASRAGARVVIVNAEPTAMDDVADALLRGSIGEILPAICG